MTPQNHKMEEEVSKLEKSQIAGQHAREIESQKQKTLAHQQTKPIVKPIMNH